MKEEGKIPMKPLTKYLLPGFLINIIYVVPLYLGGIVVCVERLDGTLERQFVAGVSSTQILFSHLLAHFPQYLANELRNLTKKSDGKWKKSSSGCHVILETIPGAGELPTLLSELVPAAEQKR